MNMLLRKTLLATVIFIFSIVGNTAATSITVTATGNLDRSLTRFPDIVAYGDGLITLGGNPTIPLIDDSDNEFISWVDDLSGIMTSEMWELPIEVTCIGNLNSFNVSGSNDIFRKPRTIPGLFPLLHDDTFIRPAVVPDPIPEPGTVILFVTGLGALGSYGWWRRRKINSLQMSVELAKIPVPYQHNQEKWAVESGKMAGEVIHDIKNSLAGIRTCAEVLGYDSLDPEERQVFVQIISQEIERIVRMTQDFLNSSYDQQRTLNVQVCSVKGFVQDILPIIECNFASRNISVHSELHYTGEFYIDVEKMKRVFMNIVDNARDAMPDGGILKITSRLVGDRIQFEIADNGHGIPPKLQAHIFEPGVTEGKLYGTGLGMAIVKDILDQHHAHINIQSASGEGTTIRISLPKSTC